MNHHQRNYIISGAGTGLGREVAKRLVLQGANLLVFSRSIDAVQSLQSELHDLNSRSIVVSISADISKEKDVDNVISAFTSSFDRLNGVVSNAGIYGPMGESHKVSWTDWKESLSVNLFGAVYLINLSIPLLIEQGGGSIVQLSGGGATQPMPYVSSYAAAKSAIVRYIESIAIELQPYNIRANSLAPGPLNTRLLDEVIQQGPQTVGRSFYDKAIKQKLNGGADPAAACKLISFLLSDASLKISGKLISALWDCWEVWPAHLDAIQASDAYTLRRVSGKDRQFPWETK